MIYKNFKDKNLSTLGLGCMRLPVNENNKIDVEKTREMVNYAFKNGVNYFDTAWGYHDGESELVMGEILKDYPRDSFYLADKFPGFNLSLIKKVEEIYKSNQTRRDR